MTTEQANKILNTNRIDLTHAAFETLTIDPVRIGDFCIGPEDGDFRSVYAVMEYNGCERKHVTMSYFIQIHGLHYVFREFFDDVLEVIEAIKLVKPRHDAS